MIGAILVLAAILGCLTLAGLVSRNLFTPNTGRRVRFSRLDWLRACTRLKREHCWRWYLKLRARFPVVRIAHPDGTAPDHPLSGAVPLQPGPCLPAIDHVLPGMQRRLDAAETVVPLAPWALAPVLYGRGANPYPADTLTDMPAVEDRLLVRPYVAEQAAKGWFG